MSVLLPKLQCASGASMAYDILSCIYPTHTYNTATNESFQLEHTYYNTRTKICNNSTKKIVFARPLKNNLCSYHDWKIVGFFFLTLEKLIGKCSNLEINLYLSVVSI